MQVEDPVESGGAEDRRLRRMNNTPQGPAFAVGYGRGKREIEGNAADDILMVDQGLLGVFDDYTVHAWTRGRWG